MWKKTVILSQPLSTLHRHSYSINDKCVSFTDCGLTGIYKGLTMLPQSLTFTKTLPSYNGKYCYSVNMTADGHLICGLRGGVEIWDTIDGKVKYSRNMTGRMYDMKQSGKHLYGAWKYFNQLTVVRYDRRLNNREEITSIPYQTKEVSQIDVRYGNIAVIDYSNKLIKLYTIDGEFVKDVALKGRDDPCGARLLIDGCVLVSDYGAGSVTKYQTDSSGSVVWSCGQVQNPLGLDVDEWGLIYVAEDCKISVLSPKGRYSVYETSPCSFHHTS